MKKMTVTCISNDGHTFNNELCCRSYDAECAFKKDTARFHFYDDCGDPIKNLNELELTQVIIIDDGITAEEAKDFIALMQDNYRDCLDSADMGEVGLGDFNDFYPGCYVFHDVDDDTAEWIRLDKMTTTALRKILK